MRKLYLDNLKGFLIILVILGHVLQSEIVDYQNNIIFRIIYSFHMPLFFFISGYLTWKQTPDSKLLVKRARQLLIPFVVWATISPLFYQQQFDLSHTVETLMYPDNGLWFLYNLFVYSVMIWISERESLTRINNFAQEIFLGAIFLILLCLMGVLKTKLNCSQLCWYFPFYAMGYYMRKYEKMLNKNKRFIAAWGGVIWLIGVPFWMMREDPIFYQWINLGGGFAYLYRFIVCLAGTVFFFIFGQNFLDKQIVKINVIGEKTLGMYAFQFVAIFYITQWLNPLLPNTPLRIVLSTLFSATLSFLIVAVIERIKYIRLLLIGKQ